MDKLKLKIAILGTRGIPNNYGGFEECAERLSAYLVKKGHDVTVYNPDTHPYTEKEWNGVKIRKVLFRENIFRFLGVFIFDYLSLRDAAGNDNDIILELGYSPAALFYSMVKRGRSKIVTNMDGLEWRRAKWSSVTRKLLKYCEKRAVKRSDVLVADNPGIQDYLYGEYGKNSTYIPYGAERVPTHDENFLRESGLKKGEYFLAIARLEPENNIDMILDGYRKSGSPHPFVLVGPLNIRYARTLLNKYRNDPDIRFMDGIYDKPALNALRYHCRLYFHGHSVGGTNPSLLEIMSTGAPIAAHDNKFNRNVLSDGAYFFKSSGEVSSTILNQAVEDCKRFSGMNIEKIRDVYNWSKISDSYLRLFLSTP